MVKQLVSTMPVSAGIVKSYVPGESTDSAVEATRGLVDDGLKATLDFLGEDTLDVEQADATVAAYVDLLKSLSVPRPEPQRRGVGQALRDRAGPPRRRPQDGPRARAEHLPGRPQRRHHGHPRHGGPHHHRLDAEHPARAAQGLPRDRCRAPGLPAPHRGGLPGAGVRGVARAAVQGRLQRARRGRLPEPARRRPLLHPLPQDPARRPGLPDDRQPRPAHRRDRVLAGESLRAGAGLLRVPDAVRHPARGAATPGEVGGDRCACTCPTARSGTGT